MAVDIPAADIIWTTDDVVFCLLKQFSVQRDREVSYGTVGNTCPYTIV